MKTGEVDWEKMRENPESARESIASGIKMTLEKAHKEGIVDAYAMMAMRMDSEADDGQSWTGSFIGGATRRQLALMLACSAVQANSYDKKSIEVFLEKVHEFAENMIVNEKKSWRKIH